eukprot:gnl/TRDRNA2_/TRDRNA2_176593_c0_seq2.p1 gnl/TRDRNA2_/TRDRNA2_176593_c0~~gnl/TRDRNA2_/TRDRNA2_176593_c0_seq2.p1  ORF type:complete len:201 (+),score=15.99 gnl/TRDRNA2_/TRDRNA2_176593_c0_seq2:235-837(+)
MGNSAQTLFHPARYGPRSPSTTSVPAVLRCSGFNSQDSSNAAQTAASVSHARRRAFEAAGAQAHSQTSCLKPLEVRMVLWCFGHVSDHPSAWRLLEQVDLQEVPERQGGPHWRAQLAECEQHGLTGGELHLLRLLPRSVAGAQPAVAAATTAVRAMRLAELGRTRRALSLLRAAELRNPQRCEGGSVASRVWRACGGADV